MKKVFGTALLIVHLAISAPAAAENPAPAGALDLWKCYEQALWQSENIAISEEGIRQAEEQYRQAWSAIPPRLSFAWQEKYQDPSHTDFRQALGAINLSLPALTGYREMAAVRSARTLTRQKELERKRAGQLILGDVAQAFFSVIQVENQIQVTKSQQKLMQDRIRELEDRARIGRSREAEVVAAQSQLSLVEANLEDLERVRAAARQYLAFLTGGERDLPLADAVPLPGEPRDLAFYLDTARQRPDLRAQEEAVLAARAAVKLSRSGHFPKLSLEGNYYVVGPEVRDSEGNQNELRWDLKAILAIPIYSWGEVHSSVRTANSLVLTAELARKRLGRQVETEIKTARENLRLSISELDSYEKALALADRNYKLQTADYRRGLVSNLDVLQALNNLYDLTLRRDQARYRAKLDALQLQVASGEVPEPGGKP